MSLPDPETETSKPALVVPGSGGVAPSPNPDTGLGTVARPARPKPSVPPPVGKRAVGGKTLIDVTCPHCNKTEAVALQAYPTPHTCSHCGGKLDIYTFPAGLREASGKAMDSKPVLAMDGDARCHFLPKYRADHACEHCGVLMSEAASISWAGGKYCLPCVEKLRAQDKKDEGTAEMKSQQPREDNLALLIAVIGSLVPIVGAPWAIVHLIRHRRNGYSLSLAWWVAALLSVAWIIVMVIWVLLIANVFVNPE